MTDLKPENHSSAISNVDELVTNGLYEMLCSVNAEEYFVNIKEDLTQVDRLVSDAVNNLVINFK